MKILMINDFGYEVGGAEKYLLNVKKELIKRGNDVKILTSDRSDNKKLFSDFTYKKINENSFFRVFPYIWNFNAKKTLKKIIKEYNPDIIHVHLAFYDASPSIFSAFSNLPCVYTVHTHELIAPLGLQITSRCKHNSDGYCIHCFGFSRYLPHKIKMKLFSFYKKNITLYITPSKHHYDLLKKYNYRPLKQIYNGFILFPPKKLADNLDILCVARLVEDKGVIYAIQAMETVLKNFSKAKLIVVGGGQEESVLKKYVKNNHLDKCIIFAGEMKNEKLKKYYEDSQLVVVPSIYPDNLPTVCIEAMSVGRPVIGTNLGGIPELVDDRKTGFIVPPKKPIAIAEKIILLLSDKTMKETMSLNAIKKSKEFSIESHVDKLLGVYLQYSNIKK